MVKADKNLKRIHQTLVILTVIVMPLNCHFTCNLLPFIAETDSLQNGSQQHRTLDCVCARWRTACLPMQSHQCAKWFTSCLAVPKLSMLQLLVSGVTKAERSLNL